MDTKAEKQAVPNRRRNFILGVLNGAIFKITLMMIDSQTVLAWFLIQLGVPNFFIGLVQPIRMGSSFLLQILVSGYLQQKTHKLFFYRRMVVLRGVALLGTALIIAFIPMDNPWLMILFFTLLTAYSMGAGLTGLAFMDIVAKVIPPTRRGAFFGQRAFWGGILGLGAGAVISFLLSEASGVRFPINVAWLFVGAFVSLALAAGLWSMVKEPPSQTSTESIKWIEQVKRGGQFLRENVPYRQYLLAQACSILAEAAGAFYLVYAKATLDIEAEIVGIYLTARTVASIVANLFWGRISDQVGNRRLLQIAYALGACVPLIALGIGSLSGRIQENEWLSWAYALVFVVSGAFAAASAIARTGYLLDVAPSADRSLYLGFTNTLLGVVRFASMLSGLIVDWAGFATLLLLSAGLYGIALILAFAMAEPRVSEG